MSGSNNEFTINCGIGKEQGQEMLAILNKILSDHIDTATVMAKLDEIIAGQKKQLEEIGKIKAQQGPWVLNPTVQQQMSDMLKPEPKVAIVVEALEDSSHNFAEGIIAVFGRNLQWPTARQYSSIVGAMPIGIQCIGPEQFRTAMVKIESALQLINPGIHCSVVSPSLLRDFGPTPAVVISVGERP